MKYLRNSQQTQQTQLYKEWENKSWMIQKEFLVGRDFDFEEVLLVVCRGERKFSFKLNDGMSTPLLRLLVRDRDKSLSPIIPLYW